MSAATTPTAEERYLRATGTSDLRVVGDGPCDADKLLAASYASMRGEDGERKRLALAVWRMRATGDMKGAGDIAERLGGQLVARSMRPGHLRRGSPTISRIVGRDIAMIVLKWWQRPTCPTCEGRGHPLIPGSPVLDTSRLCGDCHGTGRIDLGRLVRVEHADHARWLASEMESLASVVFSDMARLLSPSLDL